jgi:hypothetical protein
VYSDLEQLQFDLETVSSLLLLLVGALPAKRIVTPQCLKMTMVTMIAMIDITTVAAMKYV